MSEILNDLYQVLLTRKKADAGSSYVASLYAKGVEHMGEKILEEAQEFIDEARTGDLDRLKEEGADLLFHFLVLLADQGVSPADVCKILEGRFGTSGHEEKASRCQS